MDSQDLSIEFAAWLIERIKKKTFYKDSKYKVEGDRLEGIGQICAFLNMSERTVRRAMNDKINPIPIIEKDGQLISSKIELTKYLDRMFNDL